MRFWLKKLRPKHSGTLLLVLFVFIFTHPPTADAQLLDAAANMVTEAITFVQYGWILVMIQGVIINMTVAMGEAINLILAIGVETSGVVAAMWNIMRGFANMIFIIALIIMSFGTIFNVSGYDFRRLITRFLIAALLINFSLVIGGIIIDWTQSVSNIFIKAIGDVSASIVGDTRMGGIIANTDTSTSTFVGILNPEGSKLWAGIMGTSANIIVLSILLFSLVVLLVTITVRIPILWALLVVSPVAWITSILPSTQHISKKWWKYFIGWNLFLPIYLFFIYFGVYVMRNQQQFLRSGGTSSAVGFDVERIFVYILVCVFLIGGAKVAMSFSSSAGAGAVAAGTWGRGVAMRRAMWRGTGIPGGASKRWEQAKDEGFRIPGTQMRVFGDQQRKEREAMVGSMLGVRGANLGLNREFIAKTEKELKDIQDQVSVQKISDLDVEKGAGILSNGKINPDSKLKASDPKVYAYRKMLAKQGKLSSEIYSQTLEELSANPLAAQDFAKAAKETNFSDIRGKELVAMTTGISLDDAGNEVAAYSDLVGDSNLTPSRKEQAKFIQSNELIRSGLSQGQLEKMVSLLGGPTSNDGKEFLKDVSENRPDLNIEYSLKNNILRGRLLDAYKMQDLGSNATREEREKFDNEIRRKFYTGAVAISPEKLSKMPYKGTWESKEFQRALARYIRDFTDIGARSRFVSKLSTELRNNKNEADRRPKEEALIKIIQYLIKVQGVEFNDKINY